MLTREKLDKLFAILRVAHTAHWKAPKIEEVQQAIKKDGVYIFRIGIDPWVAELAIAADKFYYTVNPKLSTSMKAKAEKLKKRFEELSESL